MIGAGELEGGSVWEGRGQPSIDLVT